MSVLQRIKNPSDIKKLNSGELEILAGEIRTFLIENVSKTGGHLASSLGAVELAISLHRVFSSPDDKIVWDVGHQAYAHKIITGRADKFDTLRKTDGLSGFIRHDESIHDHFDSGHASNSISAGLGFACARDILGKDYSVVSVIGDGAMSGGLAFEGINNASQLKSNFIVILNNNKMSISQNVGGMSKHLNKLRTSAIYMRTKDRVSKTLEKIPYAGKYMVSAIKILKSTFRKAIIKSPVFDELGFNCIGPVDGHNIEELTDVLMRAKKIKGPVMIHIYTKKGKGYKFAENNPKKFHGVSGFDIKTGETKKSGDNSSSPSAVFGEELTKMAGENKKIVAITAAMPGGTGLDGFAKAYPDRFFDVGIAEGHAVTFAGGLSKGGIVPVVAIYSTFLQRAYDNIFHDVILQKAHVVFAVDRAGLVGKDGETHHGIFDISYFNSLPGISVLAPSSCLMLRQMLEYAVNEHNGPIAIRYPRSFYNDEDNKIPFSFKKSVVVKTGKDITVVCEGNMLRHALDALKYTGFDAEIIDVRTIKPLDTETIENSFKKTGKIISVEDNTICGGLGSIIESKINAPVVKIGYNDEIIPHGDLKSLYEKYGVDAKSIADVIERECKG